MNNEVRRSGAAVGASGSVFTCRETEPVSASGRGFCRKLTALPSLTKVLDDNVSGGSAKTLSERLPWCSDREKAFHEVVRRVKPEEQEKIIAEMSKVTDSEIAKLDTWCQKPSEMLTTDMDLFRSPKTPHIALRAFRDNRISVNQFATLASWHELLFARLGCVKENPIKEYVDTYLSYRVPQYAELFDDSGQPNQEAWQAIRQTIEKSNEKDVIFKFDVDAVIEKMQEQLKQVSPVESGFLYYINPGTYWNGATVADAIRRVGACMLSRYDDKEMLPGVSLSQALADAAFGEEAHTINPVIGESTPEDNRNGGLGRFRDFRVPFPCHLLPCQGLRTSDKSDSVSRNTRSKAWKKLPVANRTRSKPQKRKLGNGDSAVNHKRRKIEKLLVRKPCLPCRADFLPAPSVTDFQHHEYYHLLRSSMLKNKENIDLYIAMGDALLTLRNHYDKDIGHLKRKSHELCSQAEDILEKKVKASPGERAEAVRKKIIAQKIDKKLILYLRKNRKATGQFKAWMYDMEMRACIYRNSEGNDGIDNFMFHWLNISTVLNKHMKQRELLNGIPARLAGRVVLPKLQGQVYDANRQALTSELLRKEFDHLAVKLDKTLSQYPDEKEGMLSRKYRGARQCKSFIHCMITSPEADEPLADPKSDDHQNE